MLVGSPSYMSPEQLDGRVLDAHSDLWSLAVLAYEALSGSLPFEGKTLGALITAITTKKPIPPSVVATVPPALDDWFAKALAKRGEERFVSAPEMAAAFRAAMQAEPRRWRPLWWAAAAGAIALALVWLTLGTHDVPLRASPLPSLDVALPTAQATSDPSSVRGPDDANRADPAPKATARPQPRALPPPSAPHSASSYDPSDTF
jgi:serine/threonine-protein kinase